MAQYHVQRQCWQRWPRVLIMERKGEDGGHEERRYIPEGGTRDEWNDRLRGYIREYSKAAEKLNARILEESEVPGLKAEVDGLRWAIEERDQLIRDMLAFEDHHCADCLCNDSDGKREMKSCFAARRFAERAEQMGIEV